MLMSRLAAVLLTLSALGLLTGCGGGEVAYTEVKSDPPTLPIPHDQGTAADTSGVTGPTGTDGVTTKPTDATSTTGTSTTGTTTAPSTTTGTTTAPSTTTGTTTQPSTSNTTGGTTPSTPSTTSPSSGTGGASPDDQFCADNPGACNK
jgi:hypothetical protein